MRLCRCTRPLVPTWNTYALLSEKNFLKCQNFRIAISSNYSKNLGKISSKTFSLKIGCCIWLVFWHLLETSDSIVVPKIFPKYRKHFLKIACFKSFLTVPLNFLRIFEYMSIFLEFQNTYKFSQNFRIPFSSNYSQC